MTITKNDLVKSAQKNAQLPNLRSPSIVASLFEIMKKTLLAGGPSGVFL
ncbi:MAG: hypothetical protein P8175_14270 [Deltaproteobacteria bacterium]